MAFDEVTDDVVCPSCHGRFEITTQIQCRGSRWTIAVADGAGGSTFGAAAAIRAVDSAVSIGESPRARIDWVTLLSELDQQIAHDRDAGETTLVVLDVADGFVEGASVGDSEAWIVTGNDILDLTAEQRIKPLLGSGSARPSAISRRPLKGRLLVGTDGLFKYVSPHRLAQLSSVSPLEAAVDALVNAARLPNGTLQDDIAVVLGTWVD